MATIHKRIPFINGGELMANENDSPIRMITGQNSQIRQADYWFGEDGVMWVRFRTRSTVNDAWGSWGNWIKIADSTNSVTLAGKVNKSGDTMTGKLILEKGSMVFSANTQIGVAGYVNIAELKITRQYANSPVEIKFCRRGDTIQTTLNIRYANAGNVDPALGTFVHDGIPAYLYKSATSTWQLYIQKSENYDQIEIIDLHIPSYMDNAITITWKNVHVNSLPSGYVTSTTRTY